MTAAAEEEEASATTRGEGHLQTQEIVVASVTAVDILIIEITEEETTHQNLRRGEEETIAAVAMEEGEIVEIAGAHHHLLHRDTVATAMTKTAAVEAAEQAHWAEAELLRKPYNQEILRNDGKSSP